MANALQVLEKMEVVVTRPKNMAKFKKNIKPHIAGSRAAIGVTMKDGWITITVASKWNDSGESTDPDAELVFQVPDTMLLKLIRALVYGATCASRRLNDPGQSMIFDEAAVYRRLDEVDRFAGSRHTKRSPGTTWFITKALDCCWNSGEHLRARVNDYFEMPPVQMTHMAIALHNTDSYRNWWNVVLCDPRFPRASWSLLNMYEPASVNQLLDALLALFED